MKLISQSVLAIGLGVATLSFANAEVFSPRELVEASKISVDSFLTANPDQEEFVTGQKSWKTGPESKVKIYITHHGGHSVEVNYTCIKHSEGHITCDES